jgi:very-short-patch-repair endonuclease
VGVSASVDQLLATQHGVISRDQAIQSGLSHHQIRSLLETGGWVRLDANVYAVRSAPRNWERQITAAVLSRPSAFVAGRSAGYLHGFPGFRQGRPEILVPFPGNARSPLARVIRSRHFDRIDCVRVEGLIATTVAETLLTLSLRESWGTIERVVDDQLASGRLTIADFDPIFERLENARQRGLPMLRTIVGDRRHDAYQPPTSELERLLYGMLESETLPPFDRQVPFKYPTIEATVDAFLPAWNVIVEGDGRRWHTRRADFERDRDRDNAAAAAGLLVVRFTYRMLKQDADRCRQVLIDTGQWRQTA